MALATDQYGGSTLHAEIKSWSTPNSSCLVVDLSSLEQSFLPGGWEFRQSWSANHGFQIRFFRGSLSPQCSGHSSSFFHHVETIQVTVHVITLVNSFHRPGIVLNEVLCILVLKILRVSRRTGRPLGGHIREIYVRIPSRIFPYHESLCMVVFWTNAELMNHFTNFGADRHGLFSKTKQNSREGVQIRPFQ